MGAVSLQGRFHSILSQLPKWSHFETAGNCATRNLSRRYREWVAPSIQPCQPPVRNDHDATDATRSNIAKLRDR